jgi:hypothetical protein
MNLLIGAIAGIYGLALVSFLVATYLDREAEKVGEARRNHG